MFLPFEEVNPLVSLEDHKTCGCEPKKGSRARKVLKKKPHIAARELSGLSTTSLVDAQNPMFVIKLFN